MHLFDSIFIINNEIFKIVERSFRTFQQIYVITLSGIRMRLFVFGICLPTEHKQIIYAYQACQQ